MKHFLDFLRYYFLAFISNARELLRTGRIQKISANWEDSTADDELYGIVVCDDSHDLPDVPDIPDSPNLVPGWTQEEFNRAFKDRVIVDCRYGRSN